jgi:hypothetical protein
MRLRRVGRPADGEADIDSNPGKSPKGVHKLTLRLGERGNTKLAYSTLYET